MPSFALLALLQAPGGQGGLVAPLLMYGAIFAIFYFLLIRPQQQRMKAHRAMVDGVQRGDEVVTGGGLIGKVTKVDGAEAEVEIAQGVKVRVLKGTLADVRNKTAPAS